MSAAKWSGILSAGVAITVLVVAFTTWAQVNAMYDSSTFETKTWAKAIYAVLIVVQIVAVALLLRADG
jgi:uncharacterized membrane protein YidH (DUF202 family)